jgi:hypothetical protein
MKTMKTNLTAALLLLLLATALAGCNGELADNDAPVELVATNSQNLNIIDLSSGAFGCTQSVGTISLRVLPKRAGDFSGPATRVRVTRYRVSYTRTDGGRLVPAPFVRSMDTFISVNGNESLSDFLVVEPDAVSQAPFAALLPQNGGRDPDTGRPIIKLNVTIELFGETLGGEKVYDSTQFGLDFCYDCGGCD